MFGIFDSGLGGLTVVSQLEKTVPRQSYIYLGDIARLPYGTKSERTIGEYTLKALKFLRKQGAETPIIACNTASSVFIKNANLRKKVSFIFNTEVFDVITPAVESARKAAKNRRIGVLATTATIRSGVYQKKLKEFEVVSVPASVLVALAEEGWGSRKEIMPILENILGPFIKRKVGTIILSCTHFPLLSKAIYDIIGTGIEIIDPGKELAEHISRQKIMNVKHTLPKKTFFVSDMPKDFFQRASLFLGRKVKAELAVL